MSVEGFFRRGKEHNTVQWTDIKYKLADIATLEVVEPDQLLRTLTVEHIWFLRRGDKGDIAWTQREYAPTGARPVRR